MSELQLFQQFTPHIPTKDKGGSNAVIYTRVSSSDQEDNTSLGSQKKYCEIFAHRKKLNVVKYFGGTYESAKTDDRKEFNKMLTFVKRSKNISYIIVYSYDRFSRSGINGAYIVKELLEKYGISTLAATQEVDPTTPAGMFQQNVMFIVGQMDNQQRRSKVITGMQEQLLKGYWVWAVPRGYKDLNKGARASERQIVLNDVGKKLRKAFEWKAYKQLSNVEISRRLKKLGVNLHDKRLNEIFSNPFYCGIITSGMIPGQVIEGKHEAMVTRELFLTVNGIRKENRSQGYVKNKDQDNLPLKVFTKCDKCKQTMTGYLVKKKGLYYYKCRTKGCKVNRSAIAMHEIFKKALSVFHIEKEEMKIIKMQIKEQFANFFKESLEDKKALKTNFTLIQKRIDKIEERYAVGEIERNIYIKFKERFEKEKIEIETELSKTNISSSNLNKVLKYALEICANPLNIWTRGCLDTKRTFQRLLFPDGIYYNRELDLVRTTRVNSVFSIITRLSSNSHKTIKGDSVSFDKIPLVVESEGFEPSSKQGIR